MFYWLGSYCVSNSGISLITIASKVGIYALDVVVSDNKLTQYVLLTNDIDLHARSAKNIFHVNVSLLSDTTTSNIYKKDIFLLILRGGQYYLLTEHIVYFPSPKDAKFIQPESLWVQWEIIECTSCSGDTTHLSTSPHDIYKFVKKTTIPVLVLPWGIFHIFTSGRDSVVRAVRGDQDCLSNANGTLCDIGH